MDNWRNLIFSGVVALILTMVFSLGARKLGFGRHHTTQYCSKNNAGVNGPDCYQVNKNSFVDHVVPEFERQIDEDSKPQVWPETSIKN